jgi:hypothetical protein
METLEHIIAEHPFFAGLETSKLSICSMISPHASTSFAPMKTQKVAHGNDGHN